MYKNWYNHFKLIESSPQLNLVYSYRTLFPVYYHLLCQDSFISRVFVFLIFSFWMSDILFAVFVLISNLSASIFLPTMLLILILLSYSPNDVLIEEIFLLCSFSFQNVLSVVSWRFLVASEMQVVYVLRRTSSAFCLSNFLLDFWSSFSIASILEYESLVDTWYGSMSSMEMDHMFV